MPYQGSAQSVGFRNRNVIDPSKRMRQEAAQIKEQGRERIQGMKEQASQRTRETQRVSDIQASNTDYELRALSKFSNSINDLLQNEVLDLEKDRISGEIEEGKRLYAEQGPEYQQQLDEVNAAGNRSQEVDSELNTLADKAPTTEAADRVRSLSRWRQHGWNLAAVKQSGQKFGNHLITELDSNTTSIVDPETGEDFLLNAYKGDSQYEAAISYIQSEFIKNNNPAGLSAKVVNTVLMPEVFKATSIHQKNYYSGQRVEQAYEVINEAHRDLDQSLSGTAGFPNASTVIPAFLKKAESAYRKLGIQGSPFVAARKDLLEQITSRIEQNPEEVESIIGSLNQATITGHPSGAKSLFSLYPTEFSVADLRATALKGRVKIYDDRRKSTQMEAQTAEIALRKSIDEGLSGTQRQVALEQFHKKYGADHPTISKTLREYEPAYLGIEQSEAKAERLLSTFGEITEEEAENLASPVRIKYQDSIVEKRFGADSKADIKDAHEKIDNQIKKAVKASNTDSVIGYNSLQAGIRAKDQMLVRAKELHAGGEGLSQREAIIQASSEIAEKIKLEAEGFDAVTGDLSKNPQKLLFYSYSGEGFRNFDVKPPNETEATAKHNAIIKNYDTKARAYDNPAIQANLGISAPELELTADSKPQQVFFSLAKKDGKHTAYEILNAQRAKQNLKPVPLPEDAAKVDAILKQYPDLKSLFIADQSPNRVGRGIEQVGGVNVRGLMRALGFQESRGNYRADNPASYGPTNPALGKYQILWTNVLGWSRAAGMPHPGTKEDFKNNPAYQEKLAQWKFSDYVRQASAKTDDPDIAIRMAASAWYSGNMDLYENNKPEPHGPSIQDYTLKVLGHYKRGV
tara:strand:- start:3880 stop:6453 length:2574 start_codon:yes stop_codon:yes gene_type:complete